MGKPQLSRLGRWRLGVLTIGAALVLAAGPLSPAGPRRSANLTYEPSFTSEPEVILGLTHHKTGTFQIACVQQQLARAARLAPPEGACLADNSATDADVAACLAATPPGARPAMFKTHHGLPQRCTPDGGATWVEACTSLMVPRPCSRAALLKARTRGASACGLAMPRRLWEAAAFLNEVRNPIDTVVSAYLFHVTLPSSEPWLTKWTRPLHAYRAELAALGAPDALLAAAGLGGPGAAGAAAPAPPGGGDGVLGLGSAAAAAVAAGNASAPTAYGELLAALPLKLGVRLEFWHSLPELHSAARQFEALARHPRAVQVRFEDLRDAFNATMARAVGALGLTARAPAAELLGALQAGGCDPGAWSPEQRARSTHITAGKSEARKRAAEAALLSERPIKRELCALVRALKYDDPRCK